MVATTDTTKENYFNR